MGLGPLADVTLAEARQKALAARKLRLEGVDPIEARKAQRTAARLEAAKAMSFGACVEAYLQTHEAGWKNPKHRAQWRMTLTEYCKPISGLPVKDIDTDLVLRVLTPLWTTRTETAKRTRGRIERVLSWAKGRGLRDGENPARWEGHLDEMLPSPAKIAAARHHPALPHQELPAFMAELRDRDSLSARALELTILCATRTSETIGATWDEISLKDRTWTVPAARMKAGAQHKIPLSDRAVEVLRGIPRHGAARIFPLSNMAMLEILRGMRPGLTVHGFRSTFMDWAHECTNHPKIVIDMALAHKVGDKVEAAYRRGDLFTKRVKLMQAWGEFCRKTPISPVIVSFRQAP
jgi:integrase